MQDLDLIALICARLCHDLVGPVGAVANGVEVMAEEDDPDMQQQALELLAHSAELAANRLKFYRLAFGAAGGAGAEISLNDARQVTQGFLAEGRVDLDWPDAAVTASGLSKTAVKILLNLVLLAAEAMPRGGTLRVDVSVDAGTVLTARGQGQGARLGDAQALALRSGAAAEDLAPKASPAVLAGRLAATLGARLSYEHDDDTIVLEARLP